MINPGKINLELIKVQTGSYLGEDDMIRIWCAKRKDRQLDQGEKKATIDACDESGTEAAGHDTQSTSVKSYGPMRSLADPA